MIFIYIIALDEINETIRISIHDFTFLAIHRQHIIMMKFIQTCLGYVEDECELITYALDNIVELYEK